MRGNDKIRVLDPCCGHKSFWFDKECPVAVFGDIREGDWELCDGRNFIVAPDMLMDFTALPFDDNSFNLVVFDPPFFKDIGSQAYMAIKYGKLDKGWKRDIKEGFEECFRVLKEGGTLIFKWGEYQVPLKELLKLSPYKPLFGNRKPGNDKTHWVTFIKTKELMQ